MRIVRDDDELPALYRQAQSEASAAFGNDDLYLEKYVEHPRHIEFQVLGDEHGNVVSLGERECSIQRRHQKLIEESPSVKMTPELRKETGDIICKTLSQIGYQNAGTIEFLMDQDKDKDRKLYFIEMNTRIQVEHPVTEMVTDVDLVKSQIMIAAGEKMADVLQGPIAIADTPSSAASMPSTRRSSPPRRARSRPSTRRRNGRAHRHRRLRRRHDSSVL